MSNTLLPCPFCGGEAELYGVPHIPKGWDFIPRCKTTSCCGRQAKKYSNRETAIAAWNRRVDARRLALKTRVCPMCEDCPDGCPVETPKDSRNIVTNADRIRSMSDEELAAWLVDATVCERVCGEDEYCHGNECVKRVTDWLKQPVKEELT